jgi:large subunit ribosomal protein L15
MKLHNLVPAQGSVQKTKRIGRGEGSGHGGTATKGTKGQQARTGSQAKRGHEGGQMPIQRRMPKRGFINPFRVEYKVFNLGQIDMLVEKYSLAEFSPEILYINGLINRTDLVKILGHGEIKATIPFKVNAASAKAKEAITAAGGKIEIL